MSQPPEDPPPPTPYGHPPPQYSHDQEPYTAPPPPPPPVYYDPAPDRGRNGFSIAALIFGIIPICFLGVIFGVVALVQTSKSGQKGKGFAITGIVLNVLWLVGGVTAVVLGAQDTADRDGTGAINGAGRLSVYNLHVGDCFNDKAAEGVMRNTVPAVPCTDPHSAEVFAVVQPGGDRFPGDAALNKSAQRLCTARMGAVDNTLVPRDAELHWFQPTKAYWQLNHRDIACLVVTADKRAGSLLR